MKTAGQILREKRKKKGLSLDEIAQEIKIRKQYLIALEKDRYQFFPSITTNRGFIRNYAQYLGLEPDRVLAVFRRDYQRTQEQKLVLPSGESLNKQFRWSPRKTLISLVALFIIIFLTYLGYQYHSLLGKPRLEVYSPIDNEKIVNEEVLIEGGTDPDNSVTINGRLTQLDEEGKFSYRLRLTSGENKIVIEATNRIGRKTKQTRTIYYSKTN
ncbi:MAG TPA: helix-turn-helix domain-containing protein [Patescibacteria group bacterium]|nr:helix-turn-helix domain-containing protein [Patescibacteria group bacterium]